MQAFVYLAGLQLAMSSGMASLLVACTGVVAGILYKTNFVGLKMFRVRQGGEDYLMVLQLHHVVPPRLKYLL